MQTDVIANNSITLAPPINETRQNMSNFDKLYCFLWVEVLLYLVIRPVFNNGLVLQLIWGPSLLVLFIFSMTIIKDVRCIEEILTVLVIAFSMWANIQNMNSGVILAIFMYTSSLFVLRKAKRIVFSNQTKQFIFWINISLSFLFLLYSLTSIGHRVHTPDIGEWYCDYLVFDLGNSNLAGMILFSMYAIILLVEKKGKQAIVSTFFLFVDFYLILGTKCRSALLATSVLTLLYFFRGKKTWSFLILLGVLTPMLFYFIYFSIYNGGVENIEVMDKALFSGRENTFYEYMSLVSSWDQILFGNIFEAGLQNGHNIFVTIYSSLGLFGVILFDLFYIRLMNEINKNGDRISALCVAVILVCFLQSSMESTFFLGGFPGIIFLATVVALSNTQHADAPKEILSSQA